MKRNLLLLFLFSLFFSLTLTFTQVSVQAQSSSGGTTNKIKSGTALPATCTPSGANIFYRSDTGTLYTCTATDTWTGITGGSGLTSLNSQTGATQTFTNDTNVTVVSGTNAHVITWSGQLAASRGGTGLSALGAGVATWLGTPSSANLAAALTTKTGTGVAVFGTSPDFTTGITLGSVAVPTISSTDTLSNKTLTAAKLVDLGFIADANGNELIIGDTVASAVNEFTIGNAATGNAPTLTATGGDTNINISLVPKGSGTVNIVGTGTSSLGIGDTDGSHYLNILVGSNLTADRNFTITTGDAARTLSLAGDLTTAAAFITSGANSLTLTTTASTNVTLPTTGTLSTLAGTEAFTNKSYNGLTLTSSTGTFTLTNSKTFSVSNTLTLTGTDSSSIAFGAGGTVTYIGLANSWSDGVKQTFNPDATNAGINVGSHAGDPSTPANGDLWYDSTANEFTARINGANVALGAGGGGSVATDTIWDAAGDMVVGTGANTAARVAVGATDAVWNVTGGTGAWRTYVTTKEVNLDTNVLPDTSGNVFYEPLSIKAATSVLIPGNWIFNDSGTDLAIFGVNRIPPDYVGTGAFIVDWATTVTTGNTIWRISYSCVAAGELLAPTSVQESVDSSAVAAGGTANFRVATSVSFTSANCVAGDTMMWKLIRLGTSGSDTLAAATRVYNFTLSYKDK